MSKKVGNLSFYDSQPNGYELSKPYSEKTAELIDAEAKALVDEVTAKTRQILTDNWAGLTQLAELLIDKEVIMADDIEKIFGPKAGKHGEERLRKEDNKDE
jgi:cell division protease FtsH